MNGLVPLVTLLALLVYAGTLVAAGRARGRSGILAPAMTGNPDFERMVRIQANTLEGLVIFIPSLWLFAAYVRPNIAAALGAIWIIGRIMYAVGYAKAAASRGPGFLIQGLATLALLIGALGGVIVALAR